VELPATSYFPVGDTAALAGALRATVATADDSTWSDLAKRVRTEFDWNNIATETLEVYRRCLGDRSTKREGFGRRDRIRTVSRL
jgi:glycosyltransferase involved in cell wall biosynthesis